MCIRDRGVAEDCIDEALALELPVEREAELAEAVAAKYAPRIAGLPPLKARQRLAGYLQRRGLTMDQIRPVLDRYVGGDGSDES